jgi:large subunit ribosomal protein L17
MRNLAASLIEHKRIRTTDAKAKELRMFIEPLITLSKQDTLHARRQVLKALPGQHGKRITDILFNEIGPKYAERNGGYTRIIKLGQRVNDRAPVSMVELVDLAAKPAKPETESAGKTKAKSKKEKTRE